MTRLLSILVFLLPVSVALGQNPEQPMHHDHMEHRFDQPEEWAKSFDDPARDDWQKPDMVMAALHLKPNQVVADIGAGTGYFTMRLAKLAAAPKVYASDIEPSMVAYLKDRAAKEHLTNVFPVLAAVDTPNLPERVGVALIVDTYHHIGDREAYFRRLAKSLKPGGSVAIIDFRADSPEGPPKEFRFPPEQCIAEMQKAGYKLAARHDFLPRQHFLVFQIAHP